MHRESKRTFCCFTSPFFLSIIFEFLPDVHELMEGMCLALSKEWEIYDFNEELGHFSNSVFSTVSAASAVFFRFYGIRDAFQSYCIAPPSVLSATIFSIFPEEMIFSFRHSIDYFSFIYQVISIDYRHSIS